MALKDQFGFIQCADRDGDMFFHCSAAPVDIELGNEVEFFVSDHTRSGKENAIRIVVLEKGSIQMETVEEEVLTGTVAKQIPRGGHGGHYNRSRAPATGIITMDKDSTTAEEAKEEADKEEVGKEKLQKTNKTSFAFDESSFAAAAPRTYDKVTFRVSTHKKTRKKRAVDVKVTKTAKLQQKEQIDALIEAKDENALEHGQVTSLRGNNGVITCCDRAEPLPFSMDHVTERLREGDEVSFYALSLTLAGSGTTLPLTAYRIKVLPKGSVSFYTLTSSEVRGTVAKTPSERYHRMGALSYVIEDNETTTSCSVPFSLNDVSDDQYVPEKGDVVTFRLMTHKSQKDKAAAQAITCVLRNLDNRELGVIETIKHNSFGFIKRQTSSENVYFKFEDCAVRDTSAFVIGAEVIFAVNSGTSGAKSTSSGAAPRAKRVQLVPAGTLTWESVVYKDIQGVISSTCSRVSDGMLSCAPAESYLPQLPALYALITDFAQKDDVIDLTLPSELTAFERQALHYHASLQGWEHKSRDGRDRMGGRDRTSQGSGRDSTRPRELTLSKKQAAANKDKDSQSQATGNKKWVRKQHSNSLPSQLTVAFTPAARLDSTYTPSVGDTVQFSIVMNLRSKQLQAIELSCVAKKEKSTFESTSEKGIITAVREGFGFLHSMERNSSLYFSLLKNNTLKINDQVTFEVQQNPKTEKLFAQNLQLLEPASLEIERLVPETVFTGIITKESIRVRKHSNSRGYHKSRNNHNSSNDVMDKFKPGMIELVQDGRKATFLANQEQPLLRKGDEVTCSLYESLIESRISRAVDVHLHKSNAKTGVVQSTAHFGGFLRLTEDEVEEGQAAVESGSDVVVTAAELVRFEHKAVLDRNVTLVKGDVVQFGLARYGETEAMRASSIVRIKESELQPEERKTGINSSLKKSIQSNKMEFKEAKGPDGSKGFKQGWKEAEEAIVEQLEKLLVDT